MAQGLSGEMVERALAGDAGALRRLVDAHQDAMLNLAFRITGSAETSWDIVRDVILRMLEHPASVEGREDIIEEPLLHGVWVLARDATPRHDELPTGDRAVEAVAAASMSLPERSRCALALGDLLHLDTAMIASVVGVTPASAGELLTRSRLGLAEGLGVRGRDPQLVENEAARLYGLWPAEQADPMADEIVQEAGRRGLVDDPRGGPVIAGVRITPPVALALVVVPILIAAALAMAIRSGGDDGSQPVSPAPVEGFTDSATDGLPPPTTTGTTGATTRNVVSTVSPEDSVTAPGDGSQDGSGGSSPPAASPTTTAAPPPATTATPSPTTTAAEPTATRPPGGGAPPRPTTTAAAPAPAPAPAPTTTSGGGSQPPPPSEVPLP